MNLFVFLLIFGLISISSIGVIHAQETYDINIPSGAASPASPYFWQSEKDGTTTGNIDVNVGDTVFWKNGDNAAHTVTSGTPENGPDDVFDSGLFGPGKSFFYKFDEIGHYPYFCLVHPWMIGTVVVTEGFSVLPNVGENVGDGLSTFNVEYGFNRVLSTALIDETSKSITFEIIGNANSDDHTLTLKLPTALIDGPFVIWVDGERIFDFEYVKDNDIQILDVSLTKDSKTITLVGTSVVPEFGFLTVLILGISISTMIFATRKFQISPKF